MKSPRLSASPSTRAILLSVVILTLTVVDQAGVFSMYANPQAQRTQTAPAASGKENRNKLEETKGLAGQSNSESLTKHSEPGATRTLPAHLDNKPAPAQDQPQEAKKAEATDAPLPSGVTALPNLTPFQPTGWSNKIVVSTVPGTHSDSGSLSPSDTLYVDWAVLNTGDATTVRFYTKLYVDGVEKGNWFTEPPLNTNFFAFVEDFSIGSLSAGTHTLRIVADALSNVAESNEFDNEYTRTINITASLPNLTPFQPTGWSNKIVVSTVPGTHSDSGSLSPSDTLYIDWAVSNTGNAATAVRFYTKLYVDGVEKGNWFTDPPLNSSFYAFVEDYNLGSLSAGTHTLRIVADALSNIAESNEFDNEYTRTINIGAPNLTPFQPTGWSDKIIVSTGTGTHSDSGSLSPSDTLYVDWAVLNTGDATTVRFYTKLYVDGVEKGNWFTEPPLNTNFFAFVEDFSIGSLSAGTHTLRIVADALSNVAESNEFDNEYTKLISVTPPAVFPNLTPFQPTGWSNKIVVSTGTGTHSDSGSLSPSDTLYIDWAVSNTGNAATAVRFYTKLYVDGVEKGNWFTDPPLNTNFFAFVEDFSIGSLNAGAHTLRIVTDVLSNIAESNEFDNEYTRTINITQVPCATLAINVSPSDGGTISRTAENCSTSLDLLPEPEVALQSVSGRSTDTASQDKLIRSVAMTERLRTLIAKAEAKGSVRVIVGVRTGFQPEGRLSVQAVQSQRQAIAQVQEVLLTRLTAFTVQDVKKYETIPFIAMEVDAAGLAYLENSADVASIEEDIRLFASLAESVGLIGAPSAWAAGASGAGQVVAILDTGVDKTHPFLAGKVVAEACFSSPTADGAASSFCPGGRASAIGPGAGVNCPLVGCDHGTHVAGIAAGRGSGAAGVTFSGVAKDANLIAIQVFSRLNNAADCGDEPAPCTTAQLRDIVGGLEQVEIFSSSFNIASVNLSLGGGTKFTSPCDSDPDPDFNAMKTVIGNLRLRGIATVIAAGNESFTNGLSFPACMSKAISVGSSGDNSAGDRCPFWPQDRVSDFSNSAPFLNLLAPGQCIRSSVPGGGFENLAGTSMAAPHVAGAWAVLKSKFPSATVDQILSALTSTGVPITDSRNNNVTRRIQVDAALNALGSGGGGTVLRYSSGNTVTLTANANPGFAFVKWQQDGVDYSNSPTVNVQMTASHTMMAVFRVGNSTTINNITLPSGKLVIIDGKGFGSFPTVIINDVDRSNYIIGASDISITMKGKRKKMGLRAGNNTVRVVGTNGASNVYIVPIF